VLFSSQMISPEIYDVRVSNGRTTKFLAEVKRWLKKSGIKQTDLAEILGVSPQLITDWFKGRKFPVAEETLHLQELMRNPAKSQKRDSLNRL